MKTNLCQRVLCALLCTSLMLTSLTGCKKDEPKVDPNVNPTIGMDGAGDTAGTADPTTSATDPNTTTTPATPDTPVTSGTSDVNNTPSGTGDDTGTGAGGSSGESESGPAVQTPPTGPDGTTGTTGPDGTGGTAGEPSTPATVPTATTTDPWSLTPAPSAETLIKNAFQKDKTIHATLAMNMFGEMMMDLSAFAGGLDGVDTSGLEEMDTTISLYMTAEVSQDKDAMVMEGTMTSQAMGENSVDESKGYVEKLTDGTQNNYTYVAETGAWTVQNSPIENGAFGLEAIINMASTPGTDYSGYELETTDTEYIVTGSLKGGASASLLKSLNANTEGSTNPTGDDTCGIVMRFDKTTQNLKSVIVTMPPINALFMTFTTLTMAIANITFDNTDVSVPSNVKATATPYSPFDFSD